VVPVGYDAKERKLIVNSEEAKTVRRIFNVYLDVGCVRKLKVRLDEEGARSKIRIRATGGRSGGAPFSRGALYKILNNRIYLGEISHKGQCHPGEHEPIIAQDLWDQVHIQLRNDHQGRRDGVRVHSPSLLTGLLQHGEGNRLTASHTVKSGRRYRYYCQAVTQQGTAQGPSVRLPAHDIESRVVARITDFLCSEKEVMDELSAVEDGAENIRRLLASAAEMSELLKTGTRNQISELVRQVVHRVVAQRDHIQILLSKTELRAILMNEPSVLQLGSQMISVQFPATLTRRGREVRLIVSATPAEKAPEYHSQALLKAVARAHDWREQIVAGRASGPRAIARRIGLHERYVRCILNYAFLAPDIIESILDGRQPHDLTLEKLRGRVPMSWAEQRATFLPSGSARYPN
jgi:site-specific DNA recombinase